MLIYVDSQLFFSSFVESILSRNGEKVYSLDKTLIIKTLIITNRKRNKTITIERLSWYLLSMTIGPKHHKEYYE